MNTRELNLVKSIIETAAERGAIRASEFSVVGELYDRIPTMISESEKPSVVPEPIEAEVVETPREEQLEFPFVNEL